MPDSLWAALALVLVLEGCCRLLRAALWRDTFRKVDRAVRRPAPLRRARRRSALGLVGLWLAAVMRKLAPARVHRGRAARRRRRASSAAPHAARSLPRARLPARAAAAGRAPRFAADRHRARPRAADLQGGRPAVRPHARRARRHHAAGRAHRRAPAERSRASRACATRAACCAPSPRRADTTREVAADRRRALRRRRRSPADREVAAAACCRRSPRRACAGCISISATSASTARSPHGAGIAGNGERRRELFAALRDKDAPAVAELTAKLPAAGAARCAALPTLYGPADEVLAAARGTLPDTPAIASALAALAALADRRAASTRSHIDLADLRGYHYHTGAIFSVFTAGEANAIGTRRPLRRHRRHSARGARPMIGVARGLASRLSRARRPALAAIAIARRAVVAADQRKLGRLAEHGQERRRHRHAVGRRRQGQDRRLADRARATGVVRFQGGHNAGHTLVIGGRRRCCGSFRPASCAPSVARLHRQRRRASRRRRCCRRSASSRRAGVEVRSRLQDLAGVPARAAVSRRARPGARSAMGDDEDRHDGPRHRPRLRGQDRAPRDARAGPVLPRPLRRRSSSRCSSSTTSC